MRTLLAVLCAIACGAALAGQTITVTVPGDSNVHVLHRTKDVAGSVTVLVDKSSTVVIERIALPPPDEPPPPPPVSDFDARCAAPGVVRCFGFDDPAKLVGPMTTSGYSAYGIDPGASARPVVDTAIKASGAGSLRFDIPSLSSANAAGDFRANFSDDLSVQFGENSVFYVQWRQRFNQAFIDTVFLSTSGGVQGGIKQADVVTGDQPRHGYASCEALEVVIQSYYQRRLPISYNSCTGSASHGPYALMSERIGSSDFKLQNGTSPYCLYTKVGDSTPTGPGPGCFGWAVDDWMTFEVRIKLGARDNAKNEFTDSEYQLWAARDGGDPFLVIDWHPGIQAYFQLTSGTSADQTQRFGKVYLMPYMTGKDPTQVHPLAQTWYDDLIISRNPIPYPGNKPITIPRI